jgi:hypothetical protein
MEIDLGVGFLNYTRNKSYQIDLNVKDFFGTTPFYYSSTYTLNMVDEKNSNKYYNALDLELGFVYSKYQAYISSFLGRKRYIMQDDECFSWNIGNIHKRGLRTSFIYQATTDILLKADYLYSLIYRVDNKISDLKVYNLSIVYRF